MFEGLKNWFDAYCREFKIYEHTPEGKLTMVRRIRGRMRAAARRRLLDEELPADKRKNWHSMTSGPVI